MITNTAYCYSKDVGASGVEDIAFDIDHHSFEPSISSFVPVTVIELGVVIVLAYEIGVDKILEGGWILEEWGNAIGEF